MASIRLTNNKNCNAIMGNGFDMKLGQKQELFMRLLPRLIDEAHDVIKS
jgi:hypothetical protein